MFTLPNLGAASGVLQPAAVLMTMVLVPLVAGLVVGYRTTGRTSGRLRAGARTGVALVVLTTLAVGARMMSALGGPGADVAALVTTGLTAAVAWTVLALLCAVPASVVGSLLGGGLRARLRGRSFAG
jgi:hypothetical protein